MATHSAAVDAQPRVPTTGRDPYLDNAKYLAIAAVVIGHLVGPLAGQPLGAATFETIYSFHMPAFVFITGYLSRSFTGKPRQMQRLVGTVVVPYLVFEVSYEVIFDIVRGHHVDVSLLNPSFAMWFLCGLFFWRMSAPLWRAMKPPVAITAAILISIGSAGMNLPEIFDLERMFGFLPFFVAGLVLPLDSYFAFVRAERNRILAAAAFVALFLGVLFLHPYTTAWLTYDHTFGQMGVSTPVGVMMRSATLVLGGVMTTAFLTLVPRGRTWFTALGAGTLYVYLLHRFVVKGLTVDGGPFDSWQWLHSALGVIIVIAVGFGLTYLLSLASVQRLFRPVVEPRLDWMFRRIAPADRGGSGSL